MLSNTVPNIVMSRKFISIFACLLLCGIIWWWQGSHLIPSAQAQATQEFFVTSFYQPRGWMLNTVSGDRVVMNEAFTGNCHAANQCIKVTWHAPTPSEWIGLYWLHPDAGVGDWPQIGQPGCNLTGAKTVKVWARGEKGGEKLTFLAAFYALQKVETPIITLSKQWTEYTIDVSQHDLSNVVGAFGWTISGGDNVGDVNLYLDRITYQGVGSCIPSATATPTPTATITLAPSHTPTGTRPPHHADTTTHLFGYRFLSTQRLDAQ